MTRRVSSPAGVSLSVSLVLVAALASACSTAATPTSYPTASAIVSPTPAPSEAGAVPLLRVTSEGGFINPAASLAALPTVVVYADGRILTPAAPPADNPDPLVPGVAVRDVGATGAANILAAIQAAGLDQAQTGGPGIPGDSGSDVFEVTVGGATVVSRFAGSGPMVGGPGGPGASGGADPERDAAFALLDRLLDPTDAWGAASSAETSYEPVAYRIYVAPDGPTVVGGSPAPTDWPLATPLAAFGAPASSDLGIDGLRSGVLSGADLSAAQPVLSAAAADATFGSDGQSYTLFVRPLLPDEVGS